MSGLVDRTIERASAERRPGHSPSPLGGRTKRAVDIALACGALLAMWPLFVLIITLIKLSDPGPALFAHERIGFSGRRFPCFKFRSMVTNSDEVLARVLATDKAAGREWAETQKLKDDPRVTAIGRLLRATSLDELPQLLNVLRGEMSIVGPRPVVSEELRRYGADSVAYLSARPGLTGPWQVSGRSDVGYQQRVSLDRDYVENWTMARDAAIVAKTVYVVLRQKGSY